MTYQPFLPEVTAGSVEARHAAVSLRRHLRSTRLIVGQVTQIRHADRTVTYRPSGGGAEHTPSYDILVVTAGAVTRTFPVPGVAEDASASSTSRRPWPSGIVDERGLLSVRADLRVGTDSAVVPDVWAAGDDAAVPDLASPVPGAHTVPNAQHVARQGRLLARNIVADLRGGRVRRYRPSSLGVVATLGPGRGIFQYKGVVIKGLPAWLMHRGYHVLAVPTWERKVRVLSVWSMAAVFGCDLASVQHPRDAFVAGSQVQHPDERAERDRKAA